MNGEKIKKSKKVADLVGPAVAQDVHQTDQAAVWSDKYQMLWITFGKGLLIGFLLALLFHN